MVKNRYLLHLLGAALLGILLITGNLSAQLENEPPTISNVEWSPDGNLLAAAGENVVSIWDVAPGEKRYDLQGVDSIGQIAWSPDGRRIAATGGKSDIYVWELDSEAPETIVATLPGHHNYVVSIAWSPDGKQLVSGTQTDDYTIRWWDMDTYRELGVHSGGVINQVSWHPILNLPSIAMDTGGVYLLDTSISPSGRDQRYPISPSLSAMSLAWTPDGNKLAVGDSFADIYIYMGEGMTYDETMVLKGHILQNIEEVWMLTSAVTTVAWNPDGQLLASGASDGTIRIWDTTTGENVEIFQNNLPPQYLTGRISWSPYGGRLAYTMTLTGDQGAKPADTTFADGAVQIVVPVPSIERLGRVAPLCLAETDSVEATELLLPEAVEALTVEVLTDFIPQIEALPDGAIPAGCAADLIAVAEAIIAQ